MAELDSDTVIRESALLCCQRYIAEQYISILGFMCACLIFNAVSPQSVVSQTPPTHSDPPVPTVDLSNIPDDGTLGESVMTVSATGDHP